MNSKPLVIEWCDEQKESHSSAQRPWRPRFKEKNFYNPSEGNGPTSNRSWRPSQQKNVHPGVSSTQKSTGQWRSQDIQQSRPGNRRPVTSWQDDQSPTTSRQDNLSPTTSRQEVIEMEETTSWRGPQKPLTDGEKATSKHPQGSKTVDNPGTCRNSSSDVLVSAPKSWRELCKSDPQLFNELDDRYFYFETKKTANRLSLSLGYSYKLKFYCP